MGVEAARHVGDDVPVVPTPEALRLERDAVVNLAVEVPSRCSIEQPGEGPAMSNNGGAAHDRSMIFY